MRSLFCLDRTVTLSHASLAVLGVLVFAGHVRAQTTIDEVDPNGAEIAPLGVPSAAVTDKTPKDLSATDWSSIRAAYEANRHAAFAVDGGYQARNPGQRWRSVFDGRGFSTKPDGGEWTWGLQLERYGFAGAERDVCEPVQVSALGQRVAYDWDATLEEWWINDTRGLEHGYTVRERPSPCAAGPLTFTLVLRGDLIPYVQDDGRGVRFANDASVDVLTYAGLSVWDADGQTLDARFACSGATLSLAIDERGARYPLTIDPIAQQAYLKASNASTTALDRFGVSVSVSGDTVVVGAPFEDSNATGVNGNQFDNSYAEAGAAYVFVRGGTTWSQQAYLKASNTDAVDGFGWSVSVSGDSIVVGAPAESSNATGANGNQADNSAQSAGAAYVFVRVGTTWSQQAYLKASNTAAGDFFGQSVSVSGNTVVVGAPLEDSNAIGVNGNQFDNSAGEAGAAYVFVRVGTTWSQQAYLKSSNTQAGDNFAWSSVSVSGDTVAVGAFWKDIVFINAGAVYIFVRSGTAWSHQVILQASNPGAGDEFGSSVSVSGDTLVVGAPYEDSNATGVNGNQSDNSALEAGAAYVFVRSGTTWSLQAYLKASNTGTGDAFGRSVALSGDTVVVGAVSEDSNATGVNGNQADNSTPGAGAAYVFVRTGTTWSQEAYIKASNPNVLDLFSDSVSVSGDTIVVGAYLEDSSATGVNGNQADNSSSGAGAAYTFVRTGTIWSQEAYLKASDSSTPLAGDDRFGSSMSAAGDSVVIGAPLEDSTANGVNGDQSDDSAPDAGAAYVFVRNGSTWSQQAYLKASQSGAGDLFGQSVSLSDDSLVIGAEGEDSGASGVNGNQADESASGSGAAYVFVRSGTTWSQQAYLKASNTGANDQFGGSVSLSGDSVVVGADHEASGASGVNGDQTNNSTNDAGAAYVFVRSGTTWSQQAYLKASNTGADQFGSSVSISGASVVVAASLEDSNATGVNGNQADESAGNAGAGYVFVRSGTTWSQQAYLKASNTGAGDRFGNSVSISGASVAVGAVFEDSSATGVNGNQADESASGSGAAYVFVRSGTTWSQQAYLKASNTAQNDQFGDSVSVAGNTLVVGAPLEDSNATGVNGDQLDNSASSAGAVYVFKRSGPSWSQSDYVKASNSEAGDAFGRSLSLSSDSLVVGAPDEDSNAGGVNGNQLDNSALQAGAAYVFAVDSGYAVFCFGDGSGTACPCANAGSFGSGCANSGFGVGAILDATGTASIAFDTVVLTATNVPGPGVFIQGTAPFAGGAGITFGDGLLCAGGMIMRMGVVFPTGTSASYPGGLTPNPISIAGATVAGDVRHYQCWYRDSAVFCTVATYNLTQGVTLIWGS